MAESLGEVVLGVRVDSAQAIAGLNAVRQAAERSVQARPQAAGQQPRLPQTQPDPFRGLGDSADTARAAVRSLGGELVRTVAGLASIGTVAAFFKQSIDAAVQLETITKKLSNTLGEGGAAKALNFTKGIASDLGLSFKVLASSFGSFTAAATSAGVPLKAQEELFKAVATASQRLGLSNDELQGSLLALQQVAAKGTVQMEELRGQLGERLPVAFGATARGLGVTQKELIKLVETGQLTSEQFFGALTRGLNELAGASAGAPTVAQSFQQLGNAWDELQTSFGQNLLPGVTEGVKVLQSVVEGLGRKSIADRLGFNTGAIANLGVLSDGALNAVEGYKVLQKQFNLTDKQLTALFSKARDNKGFLPSINLTAQQTDALLEEVNRLATGFRKSLPIKEALIDQAIVDKTLNTVKKIQDQVKEQQQKQSGFTVDSTAFAEAQKEITELGIKLKEIDGKKAQISAEYTLKGIDSGKITNSIQNVQQSLQELNNAKLSFDVDSSAFDNVTAQILQTEQDLLKLEAKETEIRVRYRIEGLESGALTPNIANLEGLIGDLNKQRQTAAIGSDTFNQSSQQLFQLNAVSQVLSNQLQTGAKTFAESAQQLFTKAQEAVANITRSIQDGALRISELRGTNQGVNNFLSGQALANRQRQEFQTLLPQFLSARESLASRERDPFVAQGIRGINFSGATGDVNRSLIDFIRSAREEIRAQQDNDRLEVERAALQQNAKLIENIVKSAEISNILNVSMNSLVASVNSLVEKNWDVNVSVNAASGATPIAAVVSYAQ